MNRIAEAHHESGHAVAAIVCGYMVTGIDIIPQVVPGTDGQLGSAGAELCLPSIESITARGEEAIIKILVVLFSGYIAEREVNASAELEMNHEHSDGARAMKYASFAISQPVIQNKKVTTSINQDQFRALWKRAEDEATRLVRTFGAAIKALAELLETKGSLSGEEIAQCVRPVIDRLKGSVR